eukprot:6463916-Amphidinium_carterae.1
MLQLTRSVATIREVLAELSADGRYCKVPPLAFDAARAASDCAHCAAKPLSAARVKWPLGATFDPRPYLDYPDLLQAYEDPDYLLRDPSLWPPEGAAAKVHASRDELLQLLVKWDKVGVLRIVPAHTVDKMVRLGLFTVFKDLSHDRLILNPSVRNGRSRQLAQYTKFLPAGYLLCALHLEPTEVLRISSDDLREFYYTFKVSHARARSNALGCEFWGSELSHLSSCPSELASVRVLPCLATLAMGDALAPEVAQCAHWRLIQLKCGGMRPEHMVGNRLLIPRGPMYECLTYDDHCTLYRVPVAPAPGLARPDLDLHDRCDEVYPDVGLHPHPGKRVRDAHVAQVLGAVVDGDRGHIHAPHLRTLVLMRVTMEIVRLGYIDMPSLAVLVGASLVRLRDRVKNELLALACLSLFAVTDLRCPYCPFLIGTDASPFAAGIVRSEVGVAVAAELWRVGELRGFHARLMPSHSEVLHTLGVLDGALADLCESDAHESGDCWRPAHIPPLWVRELAEFLRFSLVFKYRFARGGHINCLEARAQKSCLKHLARRHPSSRVVLLQDSRVTIGSTAKGRSSSAALNVIARTQLPYIIGGGLYVSALHIPFALHRADDPSRDQPIRPPSRLVPA